MGRRRGPAGAGRGRRRASPHGDRRRPDLREADVVEIYKILSHIAEKEFKLEPCVRGTVDSSLKHAPVSLVMDALATKLHVAHDDDGAVIHVVCPTASTAPVTPKVTVTEDGAPLRDVLARLATNAHLDGVDYTAKAQPSVKMTLPPVSLSTALTALSDASGVSIRVQKNRLVASDGRRLSASALAREESSRRIGRTMTLGIALAREESSRRIGRTTTLGYRRSHGKSRLVASDGRRLSTIVVRMGGHRKDAQRYIVQNRAAAFHYDISEKLEAGIVLQGSEVKSIRDGGVGLAEAYASIDRGEVWLRQMHIASFFAARAFPHAERGARKLLLHKKEIVHLERAVMREGYTLIPLNLYFKDGRVKVTLGLGRGKKVHDKRRAIAERDAAMEARLRS